MLFDAGIAIVNDVLEIGKFFVDKNYANKIQRLLNYFNAILLAYLTGRKYLIVGTYYVGLSYHAQLSRICPKVLFAGKVKVHGEKRDIIILFNTHQEANKLLLKAIINEIIHLSKTTIKSN